MRILKEKLFDAGDTNAEAIEKWKKTTETAGSM